MANYRMRIGGDSSVPAAGLSRLTVYIGDSLTEAAYGVCPHYNTNALLSAPLKVIHNCGHSGQSVSGMISQLEESWIDTAGGAMGLVGMPHCGIGKLRLGTNNARGAPGSSGVPIDGGTQADYLTVITRILDYVDWLLIYPVPPIDGNTAVAGYNAYLQSVVAANPSRLYWIDDMSGFIDGGGNVISDYYVDGIHFSKLGMYVAATTAAPLLADFLTNQAYPSQLSTDAADVYPAQPQWMLNHTNIGTGATFGTGMSGSGPNDMEFTCSSGASGVVSKVAAEVGDPNQTPWTRITPTTSTSAGFFGVEIEAAGRTVTGLDPFDMDQVAEVRLNAVDPTKIDEISLNFIAGIYYLPRSLNFKFGGTSPITDTIVMQQQIHRRDTNVGGTGVRGQFSFSTLANFTGSMGSIDFRNYTNRG